MKKKLIFVTEALWIGGIETALVNLLHRLDYGKYDVTVLILRNDKPMAERLPKEYRLVVADRHETVSFSEHYRFSRLYHLTEESSNPSRLHRALMWLTPAVKWVENRLYIRYIRKQLLDEKYDACVIYSDKTAETAVRVIDAKKYLMFYHHGAMRQVYHDEIGYRKAEKIIAVSHIVEQKLRQFRPRYAEKMMTIHNLADVEGIRRKGDAPVDETFDPAHFHIVSCGRVSHEKGMDLAVEACAHLVAAGHENVRWWIVGGGPAAAEVREKIAQLHMEKYVTMLGMKSNPYPYIKKADLYVQPSRFEGYPMTVLEALILGQPVVSTDNGGAGEMIVHGENGLLCGISGEAVADSVRSLRDDPDLLNKLRRNVAAADQDEMNLQILSQFETLL